MLVEINKDNPQPRRIQQVVAALRQGAVIGYPTDTVYGLGCDIYNQKAVKRIFQIKKRPKHKPFSFVCSDLKDVSTYCHVSNAAYRVMKKHLPGPYTFILPAMKIVPKIMQTRQKTVGIRVPNHPVSLALVAALGNPIVTTTAALPDDEDYPGQAFEVEERFGHAIDLVVDAGPLFPEHSTVIDLSGDTAVIVRAGKGTLFNC